MPVNKVQDLIYGETSQTLFYDCPEGRPSSVTGVAVYAVSTGDDGTAETATTGSASVETNPNTTLDATSGNGATNERTINLTSTTGVTVGRTFLITSATGYKEWPEIVSVTAGVSAESRVPLHNAFATSDTFESTRIQISMLDSWLADTSNITDGVGSAPGYRARWEYVVDSVTYVKDAFFDVTRYPGTTGVTPSDMRAVLHHWDQDISEDHEVDGGQSLIDRAYRDLTTMLYEQDIGDEMIRDQERVDELVILKTVANYQLAKFYAGDVPEERVAVADAKFQSSFDQLIRVNTRVPIGTDTGGAGHRVEPVGIWEK